MYILNGFISNFYCMKNETKIIFILNPLSGDGAATRKWNEIEAELQRLKFNYQLVSHKGDLKDISFETISDSLDNNTIIAGIGGDGTHCAIINGMMKFLEKNPGAPIPPYSPVPFGTANNIAKSFNMETGNLSGTALTRLLKGIIYGANFKMDVGKIGGHYFIDDFSAGFDPHVLAGRDGDKNLISTSPIFRFFLKGYIVYLANVFKSLSSFKPANAEIQADGRTVFSGEIFNIVVNNTRIYAGEFDFTDSALPNDGLMDMLIFTGKCDYLARYLVGNRLMHRKIRRTAHKNKKSLQHLKAKSFKMKFDHSLIYQTDGEVIGNSDSMEIIDIPSALTFKIPVDPV